MAQNERLKRVQAEYERLREANPDASHEELWRKAEEAATSSLVNPTGPDPTTPAGWYDDPEQPAMQRYWDGDAWTDRRQPKVPSTAAPATGDKNKVVAGLLGIFLGGLGVHKFYLGQIGLGILYLIFFWTFIPAIVGFIEGIIYLTMSDEAFAERYG